MLVGVLALASAGAFSMGVIALGFALDMSEHEAHTIAVIIELTKDIEGGLVRQIVEVDDGSNT